jgi:monoamine oxidase
MSSPRRLKICIIGCGAAGLGAARWLLDNDLEETLDVFVLEARDRIGGRVWSNFDFGVVVDFGAAWLHDHKPTNPMSMMAEDLKLSLRNTIWDSSIHFNLKGERLKDGTVDKAWHALEKAFVSAIRHADIDMERSLESLIKSAVGKDIWSEPAFQSWCSDYDFEFGTSLKNVSPRAVNKEWLDAIEEDVDEYHMAFTDTGYAAVLNALVAGTAPGEGNTSKQATISSEVKRRRPVNILFRHRVIAITDRSSTIDYSAQNDCGDYKCSVTVEVTSSESNQTINFDADAVICCLPLGVLKTNMVHFNPALSSEKISAISKVSLFRLIQYIQSEQCYCCNLCIGWSWQCRENRDGI